MSLEQQIQKNLKYQQSKILKICEIFTLLILIKCVNNVILIQNYVTIISRNGSNFVKSN